MLTKELIAATAEQSGLSKAQCNALLYATVSATMEALQQDKEVQLQGLGTLEVKATNERTMVNPKTGQRTTIPAGRKISFRPNKNLKEDMK